MTTLSKLALTLLLVLSAPLALSQATGVLAYKDRSYKQEQKPKVKVKSMYSSKKGISESQAASIARRQSGGKVLKVSSLGNSGYRVKLLLPSGRVTQVTVNKSGRVQ